MRFFALALVATLVAACGSDDHDHTTTPTTGAPTEAPTLTDVMKMTGSLHVMWKNPAACDTVELERKDGDAGTFAVAYTLPGAADNKHDGAATADMTYTYRARCKVGAEYTPYSNELGGNPVK